MPDLREICDCRVPNAEVPCRARLHQLPDGAGLAHISVNPNDLTVENLICLTQNLKSRSADWKDIVVLLFSSDEAAENFDLSGMNDERLIVDAKKARVVGSIDIGRFRRELRAMYVLDIEKHEERLSMFPFGMTSSGSAPYETRIDLPVSGTPHCQLELSARCLLALGPLYYPDGAVASKASGTVTVKGRVRQDGTVANATRLSDSVGASAGAENLLVATAVDNLKTCSFEPASRQTDLQITYSFVIDSSLEPGQAEVNVELPHRVAIRKGTPR